MASYNLINRAIANFSSGMPVEILREKLLESGEGEYSAWLAFKAAEVSLEQNVAMERRMSLEDYRRVVLAEDEEANRHNLRDAR